MIACQEHPDRPGTLVYVPLCFDLERNIWDEISGARPFYEDRVEAIAVCVAHLLRAWNRHVHRVKVVRALSEHPNFSLDGDGISGDMIRAEALDLAEQVLVIDDHLQRLLDEPDEDDHVTLIGPLVSAASAPGTRRRSDPNPDSSR